MRLLQELEGGHSFERAYRPLYTKKLAAESML